MDNNTVRVLNQLNHSFYQTTGSSFDATRTVPWQGWFQLLPYIRDLRTRPLRVLDLGCGNGRFGVFLDDHLQKSWLMGRSRAKIPFNKGLKPLVSTGCTHAPKSFVYTGVDSSEFLLQRAEAALRTIPHQLENADILTYQPEATFDVVALFGVMHHIPGFENRQRIIHSAARALLPGGLLMVSFWAFYELERFRERIVPWDAASVPEAYRNLDLEAHDYLLDWRRDVTALRYCHYVDVAEQGRLLNGLRVIAGFEADSGNRYCIVTPGGT